MNSPNMAISTLVDLARKASEKAEEFREDKAANFSKSLSANFLADRIEEVARVAEQSIEEIESVMRQEGLF